MKEADLFRQCAKEAVRWSSRKSASADERRALINLACRYEQAASDGDVLGVAPSPDAKGDSPCLLISLWTIPARSVASR
jgi:hypothetical protein